MVKKEIGIILSKKAVSIIARSGEVFRLNYEGGFLSWCILSRGADNSVVDEDTDTTGKAKEQKEDEEEQPKAGIP